MKQRSRKNGSGAHDDVVSKYCYRCVTALNCLWHGQMENINYEQMKNLGAI